MCAVLLWLLAGSMALGQQEKGSVDAAREVPRVIVEFKDDAAQYLIRLEGRPRDKLNLRAEPLLHWGNPARTGEDGALFVWMLDGRPEVVGSVFTYRLGETIYRKHELQSLATGGLTAEYRGTRGWNPTAGGVKFRPVAGAPEPADTARGRLTQMKALAREFSARMLETEGQKSELRLIPQPLIRYEPRNQTVIDGAVFSFSLGTDPEVLLLLEARGEKASPTWQYAFARMHYVDLKGYHRGEEVWHVEPLPDMATLDFGAPKHQESSYISYHVDKVLGTK
jgi:hypothetical protein